MRIRLKSRFFFAGHLYEPGDIVDLPEGVPGPKRVRAVSHDRIDYGTNPSIDANRILSETKEEDLFDIIEEKPSA